MYKKIEEYKGFYYFISEYKYFDCEEFIDVLVKNNCEVEYISIKDDADVGFKTFGGTYTLEQIDELLKSDDPPFVMDMIVYFKDNKSVIKRVSFDSSRNAVFVKSDEPNVDLNQYIEERSK